MTAVVERLHFNCITPNDKLPLGQTRNLCYFVSASGGVFLYPRQNDEQGKTFRYNYRRSARKMENYRFV